MHVAGPALWYKHPGKLLAVHHAAGSSALAGHPVPRIVLGSLMGLTCNHVSIGHQVQH
jgi:hypothetical protein